jgi:hypothetical protein
MSEPMGNELWAWVTEFPDESVGLVGGMIPGIGMTPLIGRSEEVVRKVEDIARSHGQQSGQRVWLRRYSLAEEYADVHP